MSLDCAKPLKLKVNDNPQVCCVCCKSCTIDANNVLSTRIEIPDAKEICITSVTAFGFPRGSSPTPFRGAIYIGEGPVGDDTITGFQNNQVICNAWRNNFPVDENGGTFSISFDCPIKIKASTGNVVKVVLRTFGADQTERTNLILSVTYCVCNKTDC